MQPTKQVRAVGINLGLRLYLLLVAIFLPTFLSYYVYTVRTIESLHEREVEDVIRMTSLRVEDWTTSIGVLENPGEKERGALARELRRIAAQPNGVEGLSVFSVNADGLLSPVAAEGAFAPGKPVVEDSDAVRLGVPQRIDVLRGERAFQSVSYPLRSGGEVRGVVHLEVSPAKIGLGLRIREVKANLILGATGLVLAVGIGVTLFFHYSIRQPIRQLSDTMEDAAEGNLSALVDIRSGELGWLAAVYNRMMRRLKGSMDENRTLFEQIKGFNLELQTKVEAATAETAAKNVQLEAANDRLITLQRRLTTLEKLATLGEIATIIAHELGTPLNAISGHVQLLLADNPTDPNVLSRLKVIDGQVDRLTGIVRGVLKAMRVPPPRMNPVEVKRVIRDVLDLFSPMAEKRQISVHLRLEDKLPPLHADADQLQQVFMNLFSNAIDAMKEGGVFAVAARFIPPEQAGLLGDAAPLAREGEGCIRIDLADTGAGMDAETAKHAFEPFYTTRNVETDVGASIGLGLGLSICRQIVKSHRGEIAVRSNPGKGTEFTILLPVLPPALTAPAGVAS